MTGFVRRAEELLLLMDFDGTLTPIVATPDRAKLSPATRTALRRASMLRGVRVGVVSGRSLRDLRQMVGLPGLLYVGNHGTEIRGLGLRFLHPGAGRAKVLLRRVAGQLREALTAVRGSRVEAKGVSLSLHWRQVAARDVPRFQRVVQRVLGPWVARRRVRLTRGKCVVEVRPPVAWDKGRGIEWIVAQLASPARHNSWRGRRSRRGIVRHGRRAGRPAVMYLGDDRTDEDAFRSVNRLRGISIHIGRATPATLARWWLADPLEVRTLCHRLVEARRSIGQGR